jgi:hypothetical protein
MQCRTPNSESERKAHGGRYYHTNDLFEEKILGNPTIIQSESRMVDTNASSSEC